MTLLAAPRRPETWIGKAGVVLSDVVLAMLIVTMVPLALAAVATFLVWLARVAAAAARGI